jgi:homoserine dehydrogenase
MPKSIVKAGLIGFGTIGTGVVKMFRHSGDMLSAKAGVKLELKKICDLDIKRDRGVVVDPGMLTTNANDILNDPEIDIVIELMGGYKPAFDFVMKAMAGKKHVVTANKAMVSKYWEEITDAASSNGVEIMAEASVGGGIPILRGIDKGLAANRIQEIMAIVNGTCNYILTKMTVDGLSFGAALKEAQVKGFAEADPAFDIEGIDAMHKLIILSNLSFGAVVKDKDVHVQGIKNVDPMDIEAAGELGYVMKLLAIASRQKDGLIARVHPVFVSKNHLLASVNYEFNAIYVKGDAVGETMFYGRGAGEMPTASAVMSDVIYLAKNIASGAADKPARRSRSGSVEIKDMKNLRSKYYIRFNVVDQAGVLAKIAGVLGKNNISIESVIQKSRHTSAKVPVVIMTYEAKESDFMKAIKKIDSMKKIVKEKTVFYRVVD